MYCYPDKETPTKKKFYILDSKKIPYMRTSQAMRKPRRRWGERHRTQLHCLLKWAVPSNEDSYYGVSHTVKWSYNLFWQHVFPDRQVGGLSTSSVLVHSHIAITGGCFSLGQTFVYRSILDCITHPKQKAAEYYSNNFRHIMWQD